MFCSKSIGSQQISFFLGGVKGPAGFTKLREACRIRFHLSWYLSDFMVPGHDQKSGDQKSGDQVFDLQIFDQVFDHRIFDQLFDHQIFDQVFDLQIVDLLKPIETY